MPAIDISLVQHLRTVRTGLLLPTAKAERRISDVQRAIDLLNSGQKPQWEIHYQRQSAESPKPDKYSRNWEGSMISSAPDLKGITKLSVSAKIGGVTFKIPAALFRATVKKARQKT